MKLGLRFNNRNKELQIPQKLFHLVHMPLICRMVELFNMFITKLER